MRADIPKNRIYVEGNTARVRRVREERRDRKALKVIKGGKVAERPSKISSIMSLFVMLAALFLMALTLYYYVSVQSSLEGSVSEIASLEKQLAAMRQENDEAYSRANSRIDLEEVKRMAIQELGMKYADEGQIVIYSDEGAEDYVRQFDSIPEAMK
ncbi:MAG: cell division protein FtsL [Lachnospiraceae bacterium]|nr:cell division protein FtsL [Lachnospiraceae bacterium]